MQTFHTLAGFNPLSSTMFEVRRSALVCETCAHEKFLGAQTSRLNTEGKILNWCKMVSTP